MKNVDVCKNLTIQHSNKRERENSNSSKIGPSANKFYLYGEQQVLIFFLGHSLNSYNKLQTSLILPPSVFYKYSKVAMM